MEKKVSHKQIDRQLDSRKLLTTKMVCQMFAKEPMTIWRWRQTLSMPIIRIPGNGSPQGDSIRFYYDQIIVWAEKNRKEIVCIPDRIKEILGEDDESNEG